MNIHKKLIDLGFKKINPHKLEFDIQKGKKFVDYKFLKIDAPKWTFTYYFEFSNNTKIWAIVQKHTEITIYVESESDRIKKENINKIYTNIGDKFPKLEGIGNIVEFLPKEVKRDIILSKLFE